ncbi:MAG: glycosyltransferase [Rhodospirillales bacterium]|nr:glycosyltransferase [Rhodospirillales bacterium]
MADPRIAILLSTYDGERFLEAQLESFLAQCDAAGNPVDWVLFWRDDGSRDGTVALMHSFLARLGPARAVTLRADRRLGVAGSYLALLRAAVAAGFAILAFADQDDVWLPAKLERGRAALARQPPGPALYCARQMLVDADLRRIGPSFLVRGPLGFAGALTQNVATGCTLMLNGAAAARVAGAREPAATLHDWWCYLLVTAAGGAVIFDPEPVVLYRQHAGNLVGAPASLLRRGWAAMRRGPRIYMRVLRQNVAALTAQPALLSPTAQAELAIVAAALAARLPAWPWTRLRALALPGLVRQSWAETLVFRLWFLFG